MAQIPARLFNQMLPRAARWAEEQEQFILHNSQSRALSTQEQEIGRLAGVQQLEAVRILATPEVPFPEEADLRAAAQALGLITYGICGLAFGHGIFVRQDYANDEKLIAHELRHVAQYERYGSISTFLRRYLFEVNEVNRYPETPMEQDAVAFAESLFPNS
jgi:hypothetical protein